EARTPFKLPEGHDWYYVIGVDFGYTDPLAIVTLAFSDSHPVLFQVAEFNNPGMTIRAQAEEIKRAMAPCGERLIAVIGDPARKHIIDTLRMEYDLPIEAADKREKRGMVELASADLYEGRVRALAGHELAEQFATLQWSDDPNKEVEAMKNDCSDA